MEGHNILWFYEELTKVSLGHELGMVYPTPRGGGGVGGGVLKHDFLKAPCIRSILQHVSPLAVGMLCYNSQFINVTLQKILKGIKKKHSYSEHPFLLPN